MQQNPYIVKPAQCWNSIMMAVKMVLPSSWGSSWQNTATEVLRPLDKPSVKAAPRKNQITHMDERDIFRRHLNWSKTVRIAIIRSNYYLPLFKLCAVWKCFLNKYSILNVQFTYSQPITKVVQAVPHNDHPGKCGDPCILKMLGRIRVGMSVCVSVRMMVLRVVVMQNMVVVVVMVVLLIWLANSVMEVGVALVLTIFICVGTLS